MCSSLQSGVLAEVPEPVLVAEVDAYYTGDEIAETPGCCLQSGRGDDLCLYESRLCVCKPLKSVLLAVSHYNTSLGNYIRFK